MGANFCKRCGDRLPQDGKFCPNCGETIGELANKNQTGANRSNYTNADAPPINQVQAHLERQTHTSHNQPQSQSGQATISYNRSKKPKNKLILTGISVLAIIIVTIFMKNEGAFGKFNDIRDVAWGSDVDEVIKVETDKGNISYHLDDMAFDEVELAFNDVMVENEESTVTYYFANKLKYRYITDAEDYITDEDELNRTISLSESVLMAVEIDFYDYWDSVDSYRLQTQLLDTLTSKYGEPQSGDPEGFNPVLAWDTERTFIEFDKWNTEIYYYAKYETLKDKVKKLEITQENSPL